MATGAVTLFQAMQKNGCFMTVTVFRDRSWMIQEEPTGGAPFLIGTRRRDGVLTVEPVLTPQPLEDALYRVALLPGTPEVVLQYPIDDTVRKMQAKHPRSLLDAHPLHHHRPANPQIYVHLVHPWGQLQPYE